MDGSIDLRTSTTRSCLVARGAELRERVRRIRDDLRRVHEPAPRDLSDVTIMRENDTILERIEDVARRELAEIEHALERMDSGEFAYCEHCAEEIDERRLEIVPSTAVCGRCAHPRR